MAAQIQLPYIVDELGEQRFLGRTQPNPQQMALMRGPSVKANLPETMWTEFDLRGHGAPIKVKDQNGKGACNGHACASSYEWKTWLSGKPYVAISAWYPYAILCNGIDRGSAISEALQVATQGLAPESTVQYGIINPRQLSADSHEQAKRFRIGVGSPLKSFADMMTATQLRRPFDFSLYAANDFGQLDRNGCIPGRAGTGNHAICGGLGAKKLPDGSWAILFQNSWTDRWGDGGYAWFREVNIKGQRYFEAYDIEYVLDDPQDGTNPLPPS